MKEVVRGGWTDGAAIASLMGENEIPIEVRLILEQALAEVIRTQMSIRLAIAVANLALGGVACRTIPA
jgi:hypothetical protein